MLAKPVSTIDPQILPEEYPDPLGHFKLVTFFQRRHLGDTLTSNPNAKLDAGALALIMSDMPLIGW